MNVFYNIKFKFSIVVLIMALLLLTSCSTKNLAETKTSDTPHSSVSEFSGNKNNSNDGGNTESRKFSASTSLNSASPENSVISNDGTHEVHNDNNSNSAASNNNTYTADTSGNSNQTYDYDDSKESSDSTGYYTEPSEENDSSEIYTSSNSNAEVQNNTVSFVIDCSNAVNYDKLSSSLHEVLPSNGIIYSNQNLEFTDGETVFDVLYRITRQNGIPMEFSSSLTYNSKYIQGINSLYEFDCGEGSGWMYKVNDVFPKYGCDHYKVNSGDNIVFCYTTENGEYLK